MIFLAYFIITYLLPRLMGQVARIPDGRSVQAVLYAELAEVGSTKTSPSFLRFNGIRKDIRKRLVERDSCRQASKEEVHL